MCMLQHVLRKNDALGKIIVILTDNVPLERAITQGRATSSTRAPCEEGPTTQPRVTQAQTSLCAAIATLCRAHLGGGHSLLEDKAVQEATLLSCATSMATFTKWRPSTSPQQLPRGTLDYHFLDYFDHAFLQGHGSDRSQVVISDQHFEPSFGRNGEQTLPRSHRALQRWCGVDGHGGDLPPWKLETSRSRL